MFFPTCQVRVVRFYVSCLAPFLSFPLLSPSSTANVSWQFSPLNGKVPRLARSPHGSVPRRTSTPRSGWQCSPPDLNRELRSAVIPAEPQLRASAGSVPRWTSTASQKICQIECQKECQKIRKHVRRDARKHVRRYAGKNVRRYARKSARRYARSMSERRLEEMSDRMPGSMSEEMPERKSENIPEILCQYITHTRRIVRLKCHGGGHSKKKC